MAFHQFCVVDSASCDDLILEHPGPTRFVVFLNIPRHVCIASTANSNVNGRQVFADVSEPQTEPKVLYHLLNCLDSVDLERFLTPPKAITVLFYLFGKLLHRLKKLI